MIRVRGRFEQIDARRLRLSQLGRRRERRRRDRIGFDIGGYKIGKQIGETYYGIGILPLGGYVRMLGQNDDPRMNEEQIRDTGRRFRDTVLSQGGSRHPAEVFASFRGRAPSSEALIRHSGLVAAR